MKMHYNTAMPLEWLRTPVLPRPASIYSRSASPPSRGSRVARSSPRGSVAGMMPKGKVTGSASMNSTLDPYFRGSVFSMSGRKEDVDAAERKWRADREMKKGKLGGPLSPAEIERRQALHQQNMANLAALRARPAPPAPAPAPEPNPLGEAYDKAHLEAKAANEGRYNDIMAGYNDLAAGVSGGGVSGAMAASGGQMTPGVLDQMNKLYSWATLNNDKDYLDRYDKAMAFLDEYGKGAKKDIDRAWRKNNAGMHSQLVSRGMAGSSNLPAAYAYGASARDRDRLALEDNLARLRTDVHSRLSGDRLQARIAMQGPALASNERLMSDDLVYQRSAGDRNWAARQQALRDRLGFMERREDTYPDVAGGVNMSNALGKAGTAARHYRGLGILG